MISKSAGSTSPPSTLSFDVVIIGGALSGASTAFLLLQQDPSITILIVEKSTVFSRRVGEATVEVSTYFLCRILGLTDFLNQTQITKNGLRFWFFNDSRDRFDECGEIGGKYLSRVPAYLIDRSTLDEEVLKRASEMGAEVWRPASVQEVELLAGSARLKVRHGEAVVDVHARWVVDASGVAACVARKNGWLEPNPRHSTLAAWSRWRGVKKFDDLALAKKYPEWARQCHGIRGTATNHLMGDGWWAWWILLKGGDVSIGVTFDQRIVEFHGEGSIGERLKSFLMQHPVGRELMSEAHWVEGDLHWRKNLAYCSKQMAGDGFILVGDAAGFIDPFYSPGMDWISFTTVRASDLILRARKGEAPMKLVEAYNVDFIRSYWRWFEALYEDKYQYLGEFDLMRLAFLLDLGFYYFGVAIQPYRRGMTALLEPMFSTALSTPFFHLIRFYNRRFATMARLRRTEGRLGRTNKSQRFMFGGYTFSRTSSIPLIRALGGWFLLEIEEGWRTWFSNPAKM